MKNAKKTSSGKGVLGLLVALVVACTVFAYAGSAKQEADSSTGADKSRNNTTAQAPIISATPSASESNLKAMEPLYEKLDDILVMARLAAKGDTVAEQLVENFAKNAVMATMIGYGKLNMVSRRTMNQQDAIIVLFVAKEQFKYIPDKLQSAYMFKDEMNMIVCAEVDPVSKGVLATLFLHELYHWREYVARGRKPDKSDFQDAATFIEEVRAHEFENRAIDRLTKGAFNRMVKKVLRDDALTEVDESGLKKPNKAGRMALLSAWSDPPLSVYESYVRLSGAIMAMLFEQSSGDLAKARAYLQFRQKYSHQDFRTMKIP